MPTPGIITPPLSVFGQTLPDVYPGALIGNNISTVERADNRRQASAKDEFMAGAAATTVVGELGWTVLGGTGAQVTAEANHPGIFGVSITTTTTVATLRLGGANDLSFFPTDSFDVTWLVRMVDGAAPTHITVRFGMVGVSGVDPPTAGIYIEKKLTDTGFFGVCRNAGVETRTATALSTYATGTWYRLRMRRENSTDIAFSVNDGTEQIITTNIPAAAVTAFLHIVNDDGVIKTAQVDYFECVVAVSR